MGLWAMIAYIVYMYLVPSYWMPSLTTVPLQWLFVALALLGTVPRLIIGRRFSKCPQTVVFIVFCAMLILSRALVQRWVGGVPQALFDLLPSIIMFVLVQINVDSTLRRKLVAAVLLLMVTLIIFVGAQDMRSNPNNSAFVYSQGQMSPTGSEAVTYIYRLKALGIIADPNDFAQLILLILPFAWFWRPDNRLVSLIVCAIPTAVLTYGVYLTRSRGALVGIAVMVAMTVRRKLKVVGSVMMLGMVGAVLMAGKFTTGREISLESGADRLALWSDALGVIKAKPLWGLGYKGYSEAFGMTAHNSLLLVATEIGIIGLALWLGLFVISFRQLSRIISPPPGCTPAPVAQRHAKCLEIALGGYLTTAWFLSRAYQPTPYILLGLVAGLVYAENLRVGAPELRVSWKQWVPMSGYCAVGAIGLAHLLVRLRAI